MRRTIILTVLAFILTTGLAAAAELPLRWNLAAGSTYRYDTTQSASVIKARSGGSGAKPVSHHSYIKGGGPVVVRATDTGATFSMELKTTEASVDGAGLSQAELSSLRAVSLELPMDAGGQVSPVIQMEYGEMNLRAERIFPLPVTLNTEGVTASEMVITGRDGSVMRGKAEYTFKGLEVVGGVDCVRFSAQYQLEPEAGSPGIVRSSVTGEFNCLFAVNGGYFISSEGVVRENGEISLSWNKSLGIVSVTTMTEVSAKLTQAQTPPAGTHTPVEPPEIAPIVVPTVAPQAAPSSPSGSSMTVGEGQTITLFTEPAAVGGDGR